MSWLGVTAPRARTSMSVTLTANGPKLPAKPELPALPIAPTTSADGAKLRRARVHHVLFSVSP